MTDTATLHLRALAAVALFAENARAKTHRPELRGVHVTTACDHTTYVATDGASLMAIRRPAVNDLLGSWIIPADKITALKAPRVGADEAELSVMADGWLQIVAPDGVRVPFQPVNDMPFPDWRAVVPRTPPTNEPAAYNPDYLVRMHKAAKVASLGSPVLTYNGPTAPALVTFDGCADALGLIMPVRGDYTAEPALPAWAAR